MKILRDLSRCPPAYQGAAVALGNFDGVHRGHQAIINKTIAMARTAEIPAAVMTFEPHPREFFGGDRLRLTSFHDKAAFLQELGIEALFVLRFDQALAALSAQAFVEELLHDLLQVRHVITGENFGFGKGRQGDAAFLQAAAQRLGFAFTACPSVRNGEGEIVSSSAIRRHLSAGEVKKAAALLGRAYAISGHVRPGQRRGRELGFPTANLSLSHLFKPRFGIYAVRVWVDGQAHDGVASLGVNPMFALKEPVLEAHIFDKSMTLYGRRVCVELIDFIREEQRFDTIEALKKQMAADADRAKMLLQEND